MRVVSGPSSAERSAQARAAAYASWANTEDVAARLAPMHHGRQVGMFERQVDPDGVLSPAERARRAEAARKAHYAEMARRSLAARRAKRAAKQAPQRP